MFTQCPQCQVAFRITAEVLQQARGQVRCGSCDSAFNALDHLYEEPPNTAGDAGDASDNPSQALLQTLNRLAGPDEVRIEDTGVEWLVVDDDDVQPGATKAPDTDATGSIKWFLEDGDGAAAPPPEVADQVHGQPAAEFDPETDDTAEQPVIDEQAAVALETAAQAAPDEARYDDNTPLPDDFEEQHNYVPPPQTPMRRATDVVPDNDDAQAELELSEPGDWMDLLDEFASGNASAATPDADLEPAPEATGEPASAGETPPGEAPAPVSHPPANNLPLDVEEELAAIHGELSTLSGPESDRPADLEVRDEDLDITLDTDLDAEARAEAPDEALPDDTGQQEGEEVSIVASQLDELLEAMGSGKFRTPDAGSMDEPGAGPDADDSEALTLVGDDVPVTLELADDSDAEPEEASQADPEDPLDAAADKPAVADEADAEEESSVVYEESTGEFERAIADAEDEILAAADADAEPQDSPPDGDDKERAADGADADTPAAGKSEDDRDDNRDADGDNDSDDEAIRGEQDDAGTAEDRDDDDQDRDDNTDGGDRVRDEDPDDDIVDIAAMTGNMQIDAEVLRAMQDGNLDPSMIDEDGAPIVETIIMEGDFVRGALLGAEEDESFSSAPKKRPEELQDPGSLIDTYISNRDSGAKPGLFSGKRGIAVAVLLLVLLVGQFLHASRDSLATYGLFNQTLGPVYRMFGDPVTPTWNIKGWQFEATSGSTNETDSLLTVSSRIANRSGEALPYPLVHISLTDRYEEIMGSKVLEPDEYLAGSADPSRPVAPGDSFTAVISIASPAEEATGFKLNVCYRVAPGRVRCAIEDFKAP